MIQPIRIMVDISNENETHCAPICFLQRVHGASSGVLLIKTPTYRKQAVVLVITLHSVPDGVVTVFTTRHQRVSVRPTICCTPRSGTNQPGTPHMGGQVDDGCVWYPMCSLYTICFTCLSIAILYQPYYIKTRRSPCTQQELLTPWTTIIRFIPSLSHHSVVDVVYHTIYRISYHKTPCHPFLEHHEHLCMR